jgi:hypothetical protein
LGEGECGNESSEGEQEKGSKGPEHAFRIAWLLPINGAYLELRFPTLAIGRNRKDGARGIFGAPGTAFNPAAICQFKP